MHVCVAHHGCCHISAEDDDSSAHQGYANDDATKKKCTVHEAKTAPEVKCQT